MLPQRRLLCNLRLVALTGFHQGFCYSIFSFISNALQIFACHFSFGHCAVCHSSIYGLCNISIYYCNLHLLYNVFIAKATVHFPPSYINLANFGNVVHSLSFFYTKDNIFHISRVCFRSFWLYCLCPSDVLLQNTLCTVHGHNYSSPSMFYNIFHINPHFVKKIC